MARIILDIPDEIKKEFVIKCVRKGKFQKEVIIHLIRLWLKKQ